MLGGVLEDVADHALDPIELLRHEFVVDLLVARANLNDELARRGPGCRASRARGSARSAALSPGRLPVVLAGGCLRARGLILAVGLRKYDEEGVSPSSRAACRSNPQPIIRLTFLRTDAGLETSAARFRRDSSTCAWR